MLFDVNVYSTARFTKEAKKLLAIALPLIVAQLAQVGMGLIDTSMSGHVSKNDLAAVGLGSSIFILTFITLAGIPTAYNPIFSQLYGARKFKELENAFCQGNWLGTFAGIVAMTIMLLAIIPVRMFVPFDQYTIDTTSLYLAGVAFGMPAAVNYRVLNAYGSSFNKTRPMMWISLVGLVINIPLNWVLIHGLFGLPKLGGAGCGVATGIIMWFNSGVLYLYYRKSEWFKPYRHLKAFVGPDFKSFIPVLKLGIPISFSFFIEASFFSLIAIFVTKLGVTYVAAQQVVVVVSGVLYVLPQILSVAVSVRVGQSIGEGKLFLARYVVGVSYVVGACIAIVSGILVITFRHEILLAFTKDPEIIAMGSLIFILMGIYQLPDSLQTLASGALRGYKIAAVPMMIHAFVFWVLGLGLGYYLCFVADLKLQGYWYAILIALTAASVLLSLYLSKVSRAKLHRKFDFSKLESRASN